MHPFTIEYPNKGKSKEEYCFAKHVVDLAKCNGRMIFFTEIRINIGLCFWGVFILSV